MKKIIAIALVLISTVLSAQTYKDGFARKKTYDKKYNLKDDVLYGSYITIKIGKGFDYEISGKFGYGHDEYDLTKVKDNVYKDAHKGKFEVEDNLELNGTFKLIYRTKDEIVIYEMSNFEN